MREREREGKQEKAIERKGGRERERVEKCTIIML
jgi:hypothetical protein